MFRYCDLGLQWKHTPVLTCSQHRFFVAELGFLEILLFRRRANAMGMEAVNDQAACVSLPAKRPSRPCLKPQLL